MYKVLTIAGREVPMVANAATPYRFKGVFHEDLLRFFQDVTDNGMEGMNTAEMMQKLGYIMAMQAEKADFSKISPESFVEWLETFEDPMSVLMVSGQIMGIYTGQIETDSKAKKEEG